MKTLIPISFRRLGKTRGELEAPRKRADELSLSLCILFLIAAPLAALFFFPKATVAVVGFFTVWLIIEHFRYRKMLNQKETGPPIPLKCPACSSEQLDILSCGLWDVVDAAGKSTGGAFHYATCKKCGSRCVQYEDGKPRVPTDEELNAHIDPIREREAVMQKWPFISGAKRTL